jgi:hypothetical protein
MAIEVKCNCGEIVYVDQTLAGQHVQCPHCKGSIPVPVAMAAKERPLPVRSSVQEEALGLMAVGAVLLILLYVFSDALKGGYIKLIAAAGGLSFLGGLSLLLGGRRL